MLQKLMNWYHGQNDAEKTPPKGGIKRVGYIIANYTGRLFIVNIVFILSCIPVVTIPAAFIALNGYLIKIFRQGYNFSLADYFNEYKASIFRGIPMGAFLGTLLFYGYYLISLSGNFIDKSLGSVIMGIGIAVFIITLVFGTYLFILTAMLSLSVRHLFKNAFILMLVEWKCSFKAACVSLLMIGLLVAFLPYSLYLVLIGFYSILQLLLVSVLMPAVMKRIVEPYENNQNEGKDVNDKRDCEIM